MSGIKDMLFALMEQDHQRAIQQNDVSLEEEEFVSVEDAKHQRSAERAGDEALNLWR